MPTRKSGDGDRGRARLRCDSCGHAPGADRLLKITHAIGDGTVFNGHVLEASGAGHALARNLATFELGIP
jgi:hypothetical protein